MKNLDVKPCAKCGGTPVFRCINSDTRIYREDEIWQAKCNKCDWQTFGGADDILSNWNEVNDAWREDEKDRQDIHYHYLSPPWEKKGRKAWKS